MEAMMVHLPGPKVICPACKRGEMALRARLLDDGHGVASLHCACGNREHACEFCGNLAMCLGRYETCEGPESYACDDCCGHGNEDGHCERLEDLHAADCACTRCVV